MPINLTVEQNDLSEILRDAWSGITPGDDAWASIREMGLTEIPFPADLGGADGGAKDVVVVMTELGRTLGAAPYFSSVVMAGLTLLTAADDATRTEDLPRIVDGAMTAALVCGAGIVGSQIVATEVDGGSACEVTLSGTQHAVIDGASADLLVVVTAGSQGPALALIDGNADGVRRDVGEQLDGTRQLATVTFDAARARLVSGPDVAARLAEVRSRILVALAAEQVGMARRCLDLAVEYASTREQFGRIIGSFQAIKHKLVDLLVAVELAEATVLDAAGDLHALAGDDQHTEGDGRSAADAAERAAAARVLASRAAMSAAEEAIQVHGGIGFTWEHPLHHFFRRAKADQLIFGDVAVYVREVGEALAAGR